jgi:cytochrome c oxidase subunit 4
MDVYLPARLLDVREDLIFRSLPMSTHSEVVEHIEGASTKTFLTVWFALLFMTGVEVFLAYEQIPIVLFLTALVGLSVIKAALIIAYFMHLKFEKLSLFLTLFPMLILCIILMLLMFLPDSSRLMMMRPK